MDSVRGERTTPETAKRWGEWLKEQLRIRGWSQTDLFRFSGVKPAYLSRIMHGGGVNPSINQVAALADAFSTDPNEIFQAAGWWTPKGKARVAEEPVPRELAVLYRSMTPEQRDMALRLIRALMLPPYERERHPSGYVEPMAAYDRDPEAEDWPPREGGGE